MNDLISRQDAIDFISINLDKSATGDIGRVYNKIIEKTIEVVKQVPSAHAVKVTHGEWVDGYKRQSCSVCNYRGMRSWNYCPYCGADMRGGTDGGNSI